MSIDRSKRVAFEEVAELYDEIRPGYPEKLIEDVLTLTNMPVNGRILEIGCGPGNATIPFAKRGYEIVGVELGERLAARATQNCRSYPKVHIQQAAFEDWALEEKLFDLVIAADAFHWIEPDIGYPKAARALKSSGAAAFFWHVPIAPETDWARAIEAVYQKNVPDITNPDKLYTLAWLVDIIKGNVEAYDCFGEMTIKEYRWTNTYSREAYLNLLKTYSGHRGLDGDVKDKLFADIGAVIDQFGGSVEKPYLVALFHLKVK